MKLAVNTFPRIRWGIAAWLLFLLGCGDGAPFAQVNVSGKVTYEDGSLIPAERLVITFVPQTPAKDAKTHPRPGRAEVNVADGTFDTVTTNTYGDGVVSGKHKVLVEAQTAVGTPSGEVPAEYADGGKTPLIVDTADAPWEIRIGKPQ